MSSCLRWLFFGALCSLEHPTFTLSLASGEQEPSLTQVGSLAGGFCQPLPAQVLPRVARRGAVGGGALQHEILAAGSADDARWQEDIDHSLEQQQDLRLLQPGAV